MVLHLRAQGLYKREMSTRLRSLMEHGVRLTFTLIITTFIIICAIAGGVFSGWLNLGLYANRNQLHHHLNVLTSLSMTTFTRISYFHYRSSNGRRTYIVFVIKLNQNCENILRYYSFTKKMDRMVAHHKQCTVYYARTIYGSLMKYISNR